jgi:hypothetical protein
MAILAGPTNDLELESGPATRRYASPRGSFAIFTAPELPPPPRPEELTDEVLEAMTNSFDYSELLDDAHSEAEVRECVKEMNRASVPGIRVGLLFEQGGTNGMSLAFVHLAPNFELYRHSHPALGDCLYFVMGGSLILGRKTLRPGDGFFIPNRMPYKYRAGSVGVQVLEFRAGHGEVATPMGSPGNTKLNEASVDAIHRLARLLTKQHDRWTQWAPIGELHYPADNE